jgi:hypothetical protein
VRRSRQLRMATDFVRTLVGVQLVHQKVAVVGAYCGAEMQALFGLWEEQEHRLSALDVGPCPEESGAPGEIRTPDPQVRSLMLYPTELRAQP